MPRQRTTGFWRRPTLAALLWSLWFALLLGLPPVLTLPSALPADEVALSFSSSRACMAFAMLAGRALSVSFPYSSAKSSRTIRVAGVVATSGYIALLGFSFACGLSADAEMAIFLGFIGSSLSIFGAFSCLVSLPASCEEQSAEEPGRAVVSVIAFAVVAVAALLLSVGHEPCLTLARASFAYSSRNAGDEWWRVLVYDLAGMVGPGAQPLRFGTSALAVSQIGVLVAWLVIGLGVALSTRLCAASGVALGILACRWVISCAGFEASVAGLLGFVFATVAIVLFTIVSLQGRRPESDAGGRFSPLPVPDMRLSALSSREREAVEGRIEGLSSSEIAKRMDVQPSTVRNLQSRALSKLGIGSFDELRGRRAETATNKSAVSLAEDVGVSTRTLFGFVLLVLAALLLARALLAGAWTEQAMLGEAIASLSLLLIAMGRSARRSGIDEFPIAAAWAFLALQLGLVAAVITSGERSMSAAAIVLAFVSAGLDVVILFRRRTCLAWGADLPGFALFMGLGLVLGAWVSWPLSISQGMFVVRDSASGLIVISAVAGFVFGVVLLLGLAAASYASFVCGAHEEIEGRRQEDKRNLENRAKAFYASRGLNGTQSDVAWCVLNGMSRDQMSRELNLSLGSINSSKREVYRVLGVHSAAELIRATLRAIN